jgi:hypothetical protein
MQLAHLREADVNFALGSGQNRFHGGWKGSSN